MHEPDFPQIYLSIPLSLTTKEFLNLLKQILDQFDIACLRLNETKHVGDIAEKINHLVNQYRDIAHASNIPILVTDDIDTAWKNRLHGVHLQADLSKICGVRKQLGNDASIGAFCGISRHQGLIAAESGADYVSFGAPKTNSTDHDTETIALELFQWWSEMIEIPIAAEEGLSLKAIKQLAPFTDFFIFGDEIWHSDNPILELSKRINLIERARTHL